MMHPGMRIALLGLAIGSLAGCGGHSCDNGYVLDFIDAEDRQADLAHLGLVRDAVRTAAGPTATSARCSVWEKVRNPAYGTTPSQPASLLRPQYFTVTRIDDGWKVDR